MLVGVETEGLVSENEYERMTEIRSVTAQALYMRKVRVGRWAELTCPGDPPRRFLH